MSIDKKKICFIRAKQKEDYVFDGIKNMGYKIFIPYKDVNIFMRCLRELWFRMKLPHREIWINSNIKNIDASYIIVKDPLIVPEFIKYLRQVFPYKFIILDYDNRVKKSINPESIKEYVDAVWHYDEDDCNKYGLSYKGHAYLDIYQTKEKFWLKYDVFYVGRDKGRLDQIVEIEEKLKECGLKTYFHICANREFLTWTNKRYEHFLPYEKYLKILKESKAVLNIVPTGQRSITQREMETVFDGIKCITNNTGIKKFALYDETRYFILNDNYKDILKFLNTPFRPVTDNELQEFRFEYVVNKMLSKLEKNNFEEKNS
jgi:hypothetical protein